MLVFADDIFPDSADDALFTTTSGLHDLRLLPGLQPAQRAVGSPLGVYRCRRSPDQAVWFAIVGVIILQIAVLNVGFLQNLFDTTSLTAPQWAFAVAVASSVLWAEEIRKAVVHIAFRLEPEQLHELQSG